MSIMTNPNICPNCNAQPHEPCTQPTNTGRRAVTWTHSAREETPTAEVEDQGYSEWIDLIESGVYVNAEARVHRDFSSQSGVQGFVGASKGQKTPGQEDVRECAGCEDAENAPHESDCTRVCGTRYGYDIEGKPVVCDLSVGHAGSHLDRTHSAPAQFYWESV